MPLGSMVPGICMVTPFVAPGEGKGPEPAPIEPRNPLVGKKAPWEEGKEQVVVAGELREENSSFVGVFRRKVRLSVGEVGKDNVEAGEEGGFPFGPAKYSGLSMPVEDGWIGGLPCGYLRLGCCCCCCCKAAGTAVNVFWPFFGFLAGPFLPLRWCGVGLVDEGMTSWSLPTAPVNTFRYFGSE